MRIERESGGPEGAVWAILSENDARNLMLALEYYFKEEPRDPGWHHHIGKADQELTIAIEVGGS